MNNIYTCNVLNMNRTWMYMKTDFQVSKYTSARNLIIISLQLVQVHAIIILLRSQSRKFIILMLASPNQK